MIKVSNLEYEYPGKRALKGVSFEIPEGSITALVGPNGAGKTTLLRCLAALDEPFAGRIEIAGIDVIESPRQVHRVLGYLSDFFGLYNDLTVRQSLLFMAWLHLLTDDAAEKQVAKTAELLGLTPLLDQKVGTLSRGWRQRLGIAQAIIHEPRLILLDEPASGLDPEARFALSGLFRALQKQGMTLVISSHILAELEDYCTDMLVLRDGEIIEHKGTPAAGAADTAVILSAVFLRDAEKYLPLVSGMPGVSQPVLDGQSIRFRYSGGEEQQHLIMKQLLDAGAPLKSFDASRERLQDIYLSLSGKGKP